MTRSLFLVSVLWVCLTASSCGDDDVVGIHPAISVNPDRLEFGVGIVGRDNVKTVIVSNVGAADLVIHEAVTESSPPAVFRAVAVPVRILAGASAPLSVAFVPQRAHAHDEGTLVIRSNDPEAPEVRVPLSGVGGVREIVVRPSDVDFGLVNEGFLARRQVEVANIGGDDLVVSRVTWTSTSVDLGYDAAIAFRTAPIIVAPQTSTTVGLWYSPVDLGRDRGVLSFRSNDEDEPNVDVVVRGEANLAPRAIAWGCAPGVGRIACDGAIEKHRVFSTGIGQRLALDGRESVDPEGQPLASYRWILESRPPGSRAVIFQSTDDRVLRRGATAELEVDLVGSYEIRLIVVDDRGLSSLDRAESRVTIRPKDLEVRLRWDVATDVDLHVVRPGGTLGDYGSRVVGTSTGSDVCAYNRGPNWGDLATSRDDPALDIDNVTGRGPEIVGLDSPQPERAYALFAHYCDSHDVREPVFAIFEVYLRGELVATIPNRSAGIRLLPGEAIQGAAVVWSMDSMTPRVTVTEPSTNSPQSRPNLCRAN